MAHHHHETMAMNPNTIENCLDDKDFPHNTQVQNTYGITGIPPPPTQLTPAVCYNHAVPHQLDVATHLTTTMDTRLSHEKPSLTAQNDLTHVATIYNTVARHVLARHLYT